MGYSLPCKKPPPVMRDNALFSWRIYGALYWETQEIINRRDVARHDKEAHDHHEKELENHFVKVSNYLDNCGFKM